MVGESRDVFTKRELVEKHISGIMYENPGGGLVPSYAANQKTNWDKVGLEK